MAAVGLFSLKLGLLLLFVAENKFENYRTFDLYTRRAHHLGIF